MAELDIQEFLLYTLKYLLAKKDEKINNLLIKCSNTPDPQFLTITSNLNLSFEFRSHLVYDFVLIKSFNISMTWVEYNSYLFLKPDKIANVFIEFSMLYFLLN